MATDPGYCYWMKDEKSYSGTPVTVAEVIGAR
jgi:hypothetical protein